MEGIDENIKLEPSRRKRFEIIENKSILEIKGYNTTQINEERKKHSVGKFTKPTTTIPSTKMYTEGNATHMEKEFKKPVIIAQANTARSLTLGKRKIQKKLNIKIPKPARKHNKKMSFEDHLENRSSSVTLVIKKSRESYEDMSPSPSFVRNVRSSSTDVQKSVNDKLKSFEKMEEEFYKIINQMTVENDISTEDMKKETSDINKDTPTIGLSKCKFEKHGEDTGVVSLKHVRGTLKKSLSNSSINLSEAQIPLLGSLCEDAGKEISYNESNVELIVEDVNSSTYENEDEQINENMPCLIDTLTMDEPLTLNSEDEQGEYNNQQEKTMTDLSESNESTYYDELLDNTEISDEPIVVRGSKMNLIQIERSGSNDIEDNDQSKRKDNFPRTIHYFCVTEPSATLSKEEVNLSRYHHTPSKHKVLQWKEDEIQKKDNLSSEKDWTLSVNSEEKGGINHDMDGNRLSLLAEKIVNGLDSESETKEKKFLELQNIASELFENNDYGSYNSIVVGQKILLKNDEERWIQGPAPPKFSMPPYAVVDTLAPDYIGINNDVEDVFDEIKSEEIRSIQTSSFVKEKNEEEELYQRRILNRKHHSAMAISNDNELENFISGKKVKNRHSNNIEKYGRESSSSDEESDEELNKVDLEASYKFESVLDLRRKQQKQRPDSAGTPFVNLEKQIENQEKLERPHSQPNFLIRKPEPSHLESDYNSIVQETTDLSRILKDFKNKEEIRRIALAEYEEHKVSDTNAQNIEEHEWEDTGTNLTRSQSVTTKRDSIKMLAQRKWKSEYDIKALTERIEAREDYRNDLSWHREEFWYRWLDEDYAEVMAKSSITEEKSDRSVTLSPASMFHDDVEFYMDAFPLNDPKIKLMLTEIDRVTAKMNDLSGDSKHLGFHLCRRGACYRKIGDIKNSLLDLNRAIELEPKLLDAYWHRHLVYLLKENTKKALEDLNYITTYNNDHCNAHRSRADIYKKKGEVTLAISSYSQAIRISPKNPELYYLRAELFEERGDIILALEDYKSAAAYDKTDTRGIWKIGMYHFENKSWMACINDFTELLTQEPKNSKAYLYRGCASAKMSHHTNAIQDLSTSINLDPNNYLPFYHRACLLRKVLPKQALQDFSVSLLLNSSLENVMCYMHRGMLYIDLGRYDQASCDYEAAIRLDSKLASAHVNLGVIEMKRGNSLLAINRFNIALRMDATYLRAYLCRAEAYEKIGKINSAINDYTRAIHMKPEITEYRMARGRLLLKKGELDLASFHIRQCAAMDSGKAASVTQQAAVETFLKNFDKAIEIISVARRSDPSYPLVVLLAKTKVKAKRFQDAIKTYNDAIELMKPWNPRMSWPKESADVFFHIGMCCMELKKYRNALESFNSCLKINPEYARAYFQRGLTKMKLGLAKGVHDFNRTLAYKPKFYQAYLGRAAYYGVKGRYAKAIMNCNEALKIQKKSVRALLYRGAIKFNIKAYQLAIKDLTEAIQIDCNCLLAYFNRAVCHHERKHYFKALRDYSIVLLSDSNLRMKALLNRGLLYYQIGDLDNSLHDFTVALKEYPDDAKIHHTIGLCYHRLNQIDKAIASFTKALQVEPFFSGALLARGNAFVDSKHDLSSALARRDYTRALHLNPHSVEARVNLAYSLQCEGHFMKAWNLFTRTIDLHPDNQSSLEGRAMVSLHMSNTYGAFVDMNNALAIKKTPELFTNRGVVNQALGDVTSAMNDFQSALKMDLSYSLAYYNAANLYLLHKQFSQSITYYGRAIDSDPSDVCSFINRAVAKGITKDLKGAMNDLDEALKLSPNWSHVHYNRGNVFFALGQLEEADSSFTRAIQLQPNDALLYKRRADVRKIQGKREVALEDYRKAVDVAMKSE